MFPETTDFSRCVVHMNEAQHELCWKLQRLIFEAQTHMGGVQIAFLMHFWNNHVIIKPKERYKQCRKKATQLLP